jgi:hypothetical protein
MGGSTFTFLSKGLLVAIFKRTKEMFKFGLDIDLVLGPDIYHG